MCITSVRFYKGFSSYTVEKSRIHTILHVVVLICCILGRLIVCAYEKAFISSNLVTIIRHSAVAERVGYEKKITFPKLLMSCLLPHFSKVISRILNPKDNLVQRNALNSKSIFFSYKTVAPIIPYSAVFTAVSDTTSIHYM